MRFVLFAKRREDLTPEQFYEHWEKIHAPLTAPWLVKHKVLGYSQIHTPRSDGKPYDDDALPLPFVFDGIAEFDVDDLVAFGKAFADPYYINVIKADEVNFLDPNSKLIRSGGVLRKIVDGGKAALGTEESFVKAEDEMKGFTEEWNAKKKEGVKEG
ncbi:hypothetical protein N431DRAFT_494912 [Stipitochalara longipes BDJ]|nr:hypothetical protein N431DRAFT_494912 [Stipitochalara longipes BDJ]